MQRPSLYRGLTLAALAVALCTFAVSGAFATAIPTGDGGILNLSSLSGTLVGITSSPSSCINWAGGTTCIAGTTHQMAVNGVSADFSTAVSATDQIKDLASLPPPTLTDFETVLGGAPLAGQTVHFDLTSVHTNASTIGNCASNAAFNVCGPSGSPFVFQEDATGTQVSLSFSVLMNAYTGTTGTGVTPYQGIFTTQLSGHLTGSGACSGVAVSITNILSCEAANGTITASWSATESPAPSTPEPSSLLLMGSGLAGLAGFVRRFKRS